jgi:penicillin-binding protein 1C
MAAAPILFDAFGRLPVPPLALPRAPEGIVTATNAKLPPPLRHFGDRAGETAQSRLRILFPPDGARLELRTAGDKSAPIPLKIIGAAGPLTILVDGMPVSAQMRGSLFFRPAGPGFARVTVIDAAGAADSVRVRFEDGTAVASAPAFAHR